MHKSNDTALLPTSLIQELPTDDLDKRFQFKFKKSILSRKQQRQAARTQKKAIQHQYVIHFIISIIYVETTTQTSKSIFNIC